MCQLNKWNPCVWALMNIFMIIAFSDNNFSKRINKYHVKEKL